MSNSCAQNMSSLRSKEDLFKLFSDSVDQNVIEYIIESRNNNLTMTYQDLLEITNSSYLGLEHLHLSSLNDNKNQLAVTNSDTTNFIDGDQLSNNKTPINRITYLISKNCKVMVLMRGCPGSGKSFQAINILNLCYQNANVDEFIFSTDKYFIDKHTGKYNFDISNIKSAHTWTYRKVQRAVDCNITPIIIDNTNVQCWEMKNYVQLAVLNGYWIEVIEPVSKWAWDAKKLFNKNKHSVPYNTICLMLQRYDRDVTRENLFTRFDFKYSINNMPPKLSSSPRKYQLVENLLDEREVVNTPLTEINDQFKNCISQNHDNTKNNQCTSSDNSEDCGIESLIQEKESHVVSEFQEASKYLSIKIPNADEEDQFTSSDEGASKYVNKIVNTNENEFVFMGCLNKIPKEEYINYVRFGKSRDINEGNQKQNVFNLPIGKSDKSTLTDDHTTTIPQQDLPDNLPDISISLITELFEHCNGNINYIWKLLTDYGYSLSKQHLHYLLQIENIIGPKHKIHIKKSISKKKKFKTIGKNLENKFALDDSLGSQVKKNENILDRDNIRSDSIRENLLSVKDDEQKFVQLVVETSVLAQLCDYFHDFSSDLNKNILMTAQIPEKLATDLYYCLITNVSPHIFNRETIMQDEILARKFKTIGENLENKFAIDDSLSSQVKNNENILNRDNIISDSIRENLISVKDDEQKFVQLVVETSVLAQLCDYFHDFSSDLDKNILMTAQIPEKLATDLYYCLITNVSPHIFNRETIMQDEILARKLQEEGKGNAQKEYPCKDSNHFKGKISFSAALSKPKLSEIYKNVNPKHIMDVYRDTGFKFQETCKYLDNEYGIVGPNSPINQDSPSIVIKKKENIYEVKSNEPSNQNYEQQVVENSRLRNLCIQKANESISRKYPAVAGHLLTKAKQFKEYENVAKFKVLEKAFKNKMDLKEIDLHNLSVHEAIHILDLFLDNHILKLRKPNGGNHLCEKITIITGRGRHSPKNIARIKPAVSKRIIERSIVNFDLDKGLIMAIIRDTSLLTSEIV